MNKITKTYTFYKDTHPNKPVAKLYINESLYDRCGHIEILDTDLAPLLIILAYNKQNNIKGVDAILEDRVLPANRMFLEDYCKKHGLNVDDIDDRLKLSHGRNLNDDYYIVSEVRNE